MRAVSSIGQGFTGSTAITDLIKEYSSVETSIVSGYELRFFYDIHGIFCLYSYLVKYRYPGAMTEATKAFMNWAERVARDGSTMNYEKFFNGQFMRITREYIDRLGNNDYDLIDDYSDMNVAQRYIYKGLAKLRQITHKTFKKEGYAQNSLKPLTIFSKKIHSYHYVLNEETFVTETKQYFEQLIAAYAGDKIANFHALIPMNMIDDCIKYFDDLGIIITERDPRDVYLNKKYRWKTVNDDSLDVHSFCDNYRWLRTIVNEITTDKILRVQFEDLVFDYDNTLLKIERFVGLDPKDHAKYKKFFIPEKAAENCRLMDFYKEERENIRIIENELPEWIYESR